MRAGLSLFLAGLIALPLEGIADKGHLPGFIVLMLAPGYVIGSFISMQVHSFGEALQIMGYTSLSVDLIYRSSIFFGLFSVWASTGDEGLSIRLSPNPRRAQSDDALTLAVLSARLFFPLRGRRAPSSPNEPIFHFPLFPPRFTPGRFIP